MKYRGRGSLWELEEVENPAFSADSMVWWSVRGGHQVLEQFVMQREITSTMSIE